jgi:hypothetical protein
MVVTRTQFLSLLEPKLRDIKSDADYPKYPTLYTRLYDQVMTSAKKTEHYFDRAGIGDFNVKGEGNTVSYTDPIAGAEMSFTHVRWSNGYKITQEMMDHDQYGEIRKLEMDLRRAVDDFLEVRGHLLLNNGFGTTDSNGFKAADFRGEALISTSHTRLDAGTVNTNRPGTDANLDWTSLANGVIQFGLWKDNRGLVVRSVPSLLIIHNNDEMTARELLGSMQKPGTPNNEINALRGVLANEPLVTPYITDTNSWFLKAAQTDAVWFWDKVAGGRFGSEDDFDLEVIKRKAVLGFSHGHLRFAGWYGTSGTT